MSPFEATSWPQRACCVDGPCLVQESVSCVRAMTALKFWNCVQRWNVMGEWHSYTGRHGSIRARWIFDTCRRDGPHQRKPPNIAVSTRPARTPEAEPAGVALAEHRKPKASVALCVGHEHALRHEITVRAAVAMHALAPHP